MTLSITARSMTGTGIAKPSLATPPGPLRLAVNVAVLVPGPPASTGKR